MRSEKKYEDGFYSYISIGLHLLLKYVPTLRDLDVCVVQVTLVGSGFETLDLLLRT